MLIIGKDVSTEICTYDWQVPVTPPGGGSADLLGLDAQPAAPAPAPGSSAAFLVDVFGDSTPAATNGLDSGGLTPGSEESFKKSVILFVVVGWFLVCDFVCSWLIFSLWPCL